MVSSDTIPMWVFLLMLGISNRGKDVRDMEVDPEINRCCLGAQGLAQGPVWAVQEERARRAQPLAQRRPRPGQGRQGAWQVRQRSTDPPRGLV